MTLIVFNKQDRPKLLELMCMCSAQPLLDLFWPAYIAAHARQGRLYMPVSERQYRGRFDSVDRLVTDSAVGVLATDKGWLVIANGRYMPQVNQQLLVRILDNVDADIIKIHPEPRLQAGCERALFMSDQRLAGFRRIFSDTVLPLKCCKAGDDTDPGRDHTWPALTYVRARALKSLDHNSTWHDAETFEQAAASQKLSVIELALAGQCADMLNKGHFLHVVLKDVPADGKLQGQIDPSARITGNVVLGQNVSIGPGARIIGPAVIADNAKIAADAVVYNSVVAPQVAIAGKKTISDDFFANGTAEAAFTGQKTPKVLHYMSVNGNGRQGNFRHWPRFAYPSFLKRIADFMIALVVLILFAPIFPIIAVAIKLTSKGPVFFRDKRQGRFGRQFNCLKFRSMMTGADTIQEKLRSATQVDGPQFKIEQDPRITKIGDFLRNTYIDEIPQFINVLLGQMSVVGPRPSPESENTLCPHWRDARLSVRPGITGLWQIMRTREPMKDFQEWIHYDTRYVRELSPKMDIWICWRTFTKMIINIFKQFE